MTAAALDRNKTQLTHDVTAAVCRYLDERGFKPVETEVPVAEGWVADVAGVISPTETEIQELKLVSRKPRWNTRVPGQLEAWHAEVKPFKQLMTATVEVKTSVSDFRDDRKWTAEIPTNLAYVAIPNDLAIRADELPQGWGVLEYFANSDCLRISTAPTIRQVTVEQQLEVVHEIAVRRDHFTRHERTRHFSRQIVDAADDRRARLRMSTAMHVMLAVAQGKLGSVKDACEYHGVRNLPAGLVEEIELLWNTLSKKAGPAA